MSRRKRTGVDDSRIPFYLKVNGTAGGRYVPLTNALLLSKDFQALTPTAKTLFFALCMEAGGTDSVTLSHKGAEKYGVKQSSYDAAKRELTEKGYIKLDETLSKRESNRFRFLYRFPKMQAETQEPEDDTKRLLDYCKEANTKRSDRPAPAAENEGSGEKEQL
jgi:hypothetical protein